MGRGSNPASPYERGFYAIRSSLLHSSGQVALQANIDDNNDDFTKHMTLKKSYYTI